MTSTTAALTTTAPTTTAGAASTLLLGLVGTGVTASLTPAMHEREAAHQGLACTYRVLDLDVLGLTPADLPALLARCRAEGYRGLNVTHPCKQRVLPLLDELSPDAAALGAVNTVLLEPDGRTVGHNTDWSGFARSLTAGLPGAPTRRVVQLGAGGAGAAVAHALLTLGTARLDVLDVDAGRARDLAAELADRFGAGRVAGHGTSALPGLLAAADGLVHATPVGMAAHPGLPLDAALLRPDLWVAEVVYRPLETPLVLAARAVGAPTLTGGGMAVHQAVDAFRLFTGVEPDAGRMLAHLGELTAGPVPAA